MFKKKQIIFLIIVILIFGGVGGFGAYKFFTTKAKPKMITDFKNYLEEHKKISDNYILGRNEASYRALISEGDQCINDGDISKIEDLKSKINRLEDVIASDNTYSLNVTIDEIKKVNKEGWDFSQVNDLDNKLDEVTALIAKKKFKDASNKLQDIKSTLNLKVNTNISSNTTATKTEENASTTPTKYKTMLAENTNPALEAAKAVIMKEDSIFANKEIQSGSALYGEDIKPNTVNRYKINEDVFYFAFNNSKTTKNSGLTSFYYVGKTSNNVYRCSNPNSPSSELYLIKNNSIVKTFK